MNNKMIIYTKYKDNFTELNEYYETYFIEDIECVKNKLNNTYIDLLIFDFTDKEEDNVELLTAFKFNLFYKNTPFIVISSDSINIKKYLLLGAFDYLITPFDFKKLHNVVKRTLIYEKNKLDIYKTQTKFEMTFKEYFNSELARADRGEYKLSIMLVSIFNENIDDLTLIKRNHDLTNITKHELRIVDSVIKYNKTTILCFLPFTSSFNSETVAEKIQKAYVKYCNNSNYKIHDLKYSVVSYPSDGSNIEDLLFNAEQQLNLTYKNID